MKIRNGFVSNSSSSSFIIIINKEPNDLASKTFDFIMNMNKSNYADLSKCKTTVIERKEQLKEELEIIKKDLSYAEARKISLVECSQIPAVQFIFDELGKNPKPDSKVFRYIRDEPNDWKEAVNKKISAYIDAEKTIKIDISEIEKQLDLMKDLPDDTVIASFEIQHGVFTDFLSDFVDEFSKDGRITILKKETT